MSKATDLIEKYKVEEEKKDYRIKVVTKRGHSSNSGWMTKKVAEEMLLILRAQFPESTHVLTQN